MRTWSVFVLALGMALAPAILGAGVSHARADAQIVFYVA